MSFIGKVIRVVTLIAVFSLFLLPTDLLSCPVCYGETDSPMAAGMNMAIMTLLAILAVPVGLLSYFFLQVRRRMINAQQTETVSA